MFNFLGEKKEYLKKEIDRILEEKINKYGIPKEVAIQMKKYSLNDVITDAKDFFRPKLKEILSLESPNAKSRMQQMIQENYSNKFGILCLSEKCDNLLMWAHYTDCHKGFLIGFKSTNNFFHQSRYKLDQIHRIRKVRYSKKRPDFPGVSLNKDEKEQLVNIAFDFFLTKSNHWKYEQEWRFIRELEEADRTMKVDEKSIYLYSFPSEAIKVIILGCKMSDDKRLEIYRLLKEDTRFHHVQLLQAGIDLKNFQLNFLPAGEVLS